MNLTKYTLCLIFRSSAPGYFSIERVFKLLVKVFPGKFNVISSEVPFSRVLPSSLIKNILFVRNIKADVYHITGDIHYVVFGVPSKKTILTIHDCVFMYRHRGAKRLFFRLLYLKLPVLYSRVVTTISEQTKNDIIKFTGCPAEKIRVIPNPVDDNIRFIQRSFNNNCPRILFIGSVPHKNLLRVIESLKGFYCILDIVGRLSNDLIIQLKESGIKYELSAGLSDNELAEKYSNCDILLFPSTFEGFGLPIIEGQKAGRVVITSNLSPMKEVAGKGAHLINPFNSNEIRDAVELVCDNDEYREQLIQKGFENCRKYSKDIIAEQFLDLYRMIIKSS